MEKLIFVGIVFLAVLFIMLGVLDIWFIPNSVYLIAMNLLIGLKIACGFFVIFYRFIAVERR
jgi:multicomponent Na+:H+ antiporter subunit B